jgi:hypothetical protein
LCHVCAWDVGFWEGGGGVCCGGVIAPGGTDTQRRKQESEVTEWLKREKKKRKKEKIKKGKEKEKEKTFDVSPLYTFAQTVVSEVHGICRPLY